MNERTRLQFPLVVSIVVAGVLTTGCQEAYRKEPSGAAKVRFEHLAINIDDPAAMAKWYCENLGMKIVRTWSANDVHFVSDAGGNMMFELYNNPEGPIGNFSATPHTMTHISFATSDAEAVRDKLVAAGATQVGETVVNSDGDKVINMRDPWGLPIQFVQRTQSMLKGY